MGQFFYFPNEFRSMERDRYRDSTGAIPTNGLLAGKSGSQSMVADHHIAEEEQVNAAVRCYFLGKLRVATDGLPTIVHMRSPSPPHTSLQNPTDDSRHLPADGDAGRLRSVEGDPEEVAKACTYIALHEAHKLHNLEEYGAIRIAGLKGLLYAVKGDYKATKHFLCRSVIIPDGANIGSHFFHEYVVNVFAEALGYLLTHVIDFRVPILDCSHSALGDCQNVHAIYPFFLQQLGLLQEEVSAHVLQDSEDNSESLLEFARLNPCWPEASCACFHAYYRAACMAVLDQDVKKARVILLEAVKQAQMSTVMQCSLWVALGEMEYECKNFGQALKDYSEALGLRLDQEALQANTISSQFLCEQIMKLVPLAVCGNLPSHMQGPAAADADPSDFLAFALWVLSLSEEQDKQMILWQKVAHLVAVKQLQSYPWISHALDQLELRYSHAGAYSSAVDVCVVHSTMSNSVYVQVSCLSRATGYWHMAGELGKALEIVDKQLIPRLPQLIDSAWEAHAGIQISAADFYDAVGRSDEAFALRQAATDLVSCRGLSSSEYELHEGILIGVVALLQDCMRRKSWPLANKLVSSFDTQIHKHFSGTAKWKQWQMLKARIAEGLGEYESASVILREVVETLKDHTDPEPEHQHYFLFLRAMAYKQAGAGNWNQVLKMTQKMLEELRKLPTSIKTKYSEMGVHILRAKAFNHIAEGEERSKLEIEKAVKLYDTWSMSRDLVAPGDQNIYGRLFADSRAQVYLMQAQTALQSDPKGETAWELTQVAESLGHSAGDSEILAAVKYAQALVRKKQEQWSEAAKLARESVIIHAQLQREFCTPVEFEAMAWNWFFCGNMQDAFWLLQDLYATNLKDAKISLWWAERANMRCFLHQMNRQPLETPLLNPVDVDECDTLLQSVILITAQSFSAKTAIIHYSYNPEMSKILMYVVKLCSPPETGDRDRIEVAIYVKHCPLPSWFENAGLPRTTRLEAVIKKAQTDIQNGADKKGKGPPKDECTLQSLLQYGADQKGKGLIKDLCTLHSLLIEFIEPELGDCDTLVIAPGHGCLSSVPFAALTDQRTGKFLVESKAITLIPSILILHHCLHRQIKFEMSNQLPVNPENVPYLSLFLSCNPEAIDPGSNWVPSKAAFIAGDPEPMGLGLPQLGYARYEVSLVASYFGVQPCLGRNMSKKAVLDGLASSNVVVLATHGVVDDRYPYGCLVMKRPEEGGAESRGKTAGMEVGARMAVTRQQLLKALGGGGGGGGGEDEASSSNMQQMKYGDGPVETGHRIFENRDERSHRTKEEEEQQVLTAAEIAGVEGGINAGMVVLSACESGLGAETQSEGVLGLGRALLQGGAASALLTLWKVSDSTSMAFISGLLYSARIEPLHRGKTMCECLQFMMQSWIDLGLPIKWWASFQLVGSPLIRLSSMYDIKEKGASWLDECAFTFFENQHSTRCSFPCRVCDRKFEVQIDAHSPPTLLESIPVHPYIARFVQTHALPAFDQLPPEHMHAVVYFSKFDLAFIAKRDGNVSQVVKKK